MRAVVSRLLLAVPLLLVVSALSFVLLSVTPGDAALEILGPFPPRAQYLQLRHSMGLDLPLYDQYWRWLSHALRGDFGSSLLTGEPVTHAIDARLPVTFSLMGGALLLSIVFGVGIGIFSAIRGGAVGRAADALSLIGFAVPSFWLGAALIAVFAVDLRWLPATGYVSLSQSPTQWVRSLVLPVFALSLGGIAGIAKQTREAMCDALASEYVRTARASGVAPWSIVFRHALKNASLRVVTLVGLLVVGLLGGTVFAESVFALPGLGSLAVTAAQQHDLPVIEGIVVYFTLMVVVVNLAVDLLYVLLNPKVGPA